MKFYYLNCRWPFETNTSPMFELSFFVLSVSGLYTATLLSCVDGTYLTFCGYVSAQFKTVETDIHTIAKKAKPKTTYITTRQENDDILLALAAVVNKHNRVISLNDEFSKIFEINIIIQLIVSAAHIAALGVAFLFAENFTEASIYLTFILADLIKLFIYCYGGTLIIDSVRYFLCNK